MDSVWVSNGTCYVNETECEQLYPDDCHECPDLSSNPERIYLVNNIHICFGILIMITGIFGILGNLTSIFVLTRHAVSSVFNSLLVILAYFDILYISMRLLEDGIRLINRFQAQDNFNSTFKDQLPCQKIESKSSSKFFNLLFPLILHPFSHIFQNCSIYMTILISMDRYIAIVHPLSSYRRNSVYLGDFLSYGNKKVMFYTVAVFMFCVLFGIPLFLEHEQFHLDRIQQTSLRNKYDYWMWYSIITDLFITVIFPFASLMYFNIRIFIVIQHQTGSSNHKAAITLFGIVVCFLLCSSFKAFYNIYAMLHLSNIFACEDFSPHLGMSFLDHIIWDITRFFQIFNSSANFVIFVFINKKFRNVFCKYVGSNFMRRMSGKESEDSAIVWHTRTSVL